jgi:hypothetical protein
MEEALCTSSWDHDLLECFRAVERHRLDRILVAAAIVCSRAEDYLQHFRAVGGLLARAETRCLIEHDEAVRGRRAWVSHEAELRLRTLPPRQRRAALLDPQPGPAVFISLRRRLKMLQEIDAAA